MARKKTRRTGSTNKYFSPRSPFPYILIVALGLIYYYKALSPKVMVYATDQITAGYAFRLFYAEILRTLHKIPFWDPYLFSGLPFIDAFHGDIFYPLSFLRFILPVHIVMNWFFILHTIVAGIFMFLYLRELKLEVIPSFLFSVSYMFAGSIASLIFPGHDAKVAIAAILPLVFYFLRKGVRNENYRWFLAGSIPLGLGLLAPHVQMMYYLYMATFFYFLYEGFLKYKEKGTGTFVKLSLFFVLMVIVSLLIGAVQLLPAYEYVSRFSPRGAGNRGYEFATTWSLPWEDYISAFFAKFSGYMESYWGRNPFKINTEYVGVLAPLFALFAFGGRRKKDSVSFFVFLFVFFSIMALGGYTPLYRLFYLILPGVKKFRASSMSFYLVAFSVNVLGAIGFSRFNDLRGSKYFRKVAMAIGIIILVGLLSLALKAPFISIIRSLFIRSGDKLNALFSHYSQVPASFLRFGIISALVLYAASRLGTRGPRVVPPLLLLMLIDLWSVDWNFLKTIPDVKSYYREDGVVRFLKKDRGVYRVFPLFYKVDDNFLMVHGIESIGGHHGNQFQRYQEYVGNPEHFMFRPNQVPNLLKYPTFTDLLNVKYVVTQPIPRDISKYQTRPEVYSLLKDVRNLLDTTNFELVKTLRESGSSYEIYRNKNFIPRVLFVDSVEVLPKDSVLERMKDPSFDPRKIALLESSPDFVLHPSADSLTYSFSFLERKPDYVGFEVEVNRPALLLYLENYYPKYRAYIDGKPVSCYRTDYIFRSIYVEKPGKHTVEFKFSGKEYNVLGAISVLSILAIILLLAFNRERRKPTS